MVVRIVEQLQRRESDLAIRNIPRNKELGLGFRGDCLAKIKARVLREGIDIGEEVDVEGADDVGGGVGEVLGLQGGDAGLRQDGDDLRYWAIGERERRHLSLSLPPNFEPFPFLFFFFPLFLKFTSSDLCVMKLGSDR